MCVGDVGVRQSALAPLNPNSLHLLSKKTPPDFRKPPDCFVWMYRQILQTIQKKDRGSLGCFISAQGGKASLRVDLRDLSDTSGSSALDARNGSIVATNFWECKEAPLDTAKALFLVE